MDLAYVVGMLKIAGKSSPEFRDPVVMFTVLYLAKQASKISKSIDALNEKIARVIERVDSHEVRLQAIEVHGKPSP
jgi:hypothetical protein